MKSAIVGRPVIDVALKRDVVALYRRHAAGCCLHIVLDDGNTDQDHADFCVKYAAERGCQCEGLARRLAAMTRTQRMRAYAEKRQWAAAELA